MDTEKIKLLEAVTIDWLSPIKRSWETYYTVAERYYRDNGHLDVPITYVDGSGVRLGRWVRQMKDERDKLTITWANGDKRERLAVIGMKW